MKGLLLDTHALIWYAEGVAQLSRKARIEITKFSEKGMVFLSPISVWEIGMLERKKRISFEMPCLTWVNQALDKVGITMTPLSPTIMIDSCNLPGTFHADPSDRMIVATARVENLDLVTRDGHILKYGKSGHLSVLKA